MRVLSTRTTPEGYKRRRYESASKRRHSTIEVPVEVWQRVNTVGSQRDRAAQAQRALERESLRVQARSLFAMGRTPAEIAAAISVPRRTVSRWVGGSP
jgi:hypothetical protein